MLSNQIALFLLQLVGMTVLFLTSLLTLAFLFYRHRVRRYVTRHKSINRTLRVAFFHPYCNGGGGGERVLWQAINAIQLKYPNVSCVVYTCEDVSLSELLDNVSRAFYINLLPNLELIYLEGVRYIEARSYPRFTILLQNLGSLLLAHEALHKFQPDIFVDTIGYAFTIPYFKYFASSSTCCYVHYPTVSTDMLEKVKSQKGDFNNDTKISNSLVLTNLKLIYYRLFAYVYGWAGRKCDVTLVNSTWTRGHISAIWGHNSNAQIVYPPCDTIAFAGLNLTRQRSKDRYIVCSLGQFRPEKNHACQIRAFSTFLESLTEEERKSCELHLIGSCRDQGDLDRVQELCKLSGGLGIRDNVSFHIKIPFHELLRCLAMSDVGMHTMENEHFGISLVEMMAAGCVMIGHNSGGPRLDIVRDYEGVKTGFLADNEAEFADRLKEVYLMDCEERQSICKNARNYVLDKFSIETFEKEFILKTEVIFDKYLQS